MMVTFVSECEKNALNKTRQVLDAFANRIGERTWQTMITLEGLLAVRKLLRRTASKNTAVACHLIRGRNRSEMIWIVGNRNKFNAQGIVPVNSTQKTIMNTQWENDWHYLPLIKSLTALAALFHDWGKSSCCFQDKLKPYKAKKVIADPLRHEWVSVILLNALINSETDEQWLTRLANGEINGQAIKDIAVQNNGNPLSRLPASASLIAWLVVAHHKLPIPPRKEIDAKRYNGYPLATFDDLFKVIAQQWGYENNREEDQKTFNKRLAQCFYFPNGLPNQSCAWLKQTKKWAARMKDCLPLLKQAMLDGSWRIILYHARLSLMLGDHYHSSLDADKKWHSELDLYANTNRATGLLKQKLDEHLVGVAKQALNNAHLLPAFEKELPRAHDVKALNRKSRAIAFKWQDKAVAKIKLWQQNLPEAQKGKPQGFFAVNMASTGCGKTFANAKVMRALSQDGQSLRYVLALGLRTLTLQTGDEYRERIGLDNSEMAVMIGSRAVMELHQRDKQSQMEDLQEDNGETGSESLESLLDDTIIDYECAIPEGGLATVLPDDRSRQLLYAPVLACTIDHLMGATETLRGGRYILPSLRLMSSDLVIDEIDDFDGKDLIAIGRLIHLAGMLGHKVMISSATIPPDLAEGYFNSYCEGWRLFANTRSVSHNLGCAWIDEFTTLVETVPDSNTALTSYQQLHHSFIQKRIKKLQGVPIKRIAEIIQCDFIDERSDKNNEDNLERAYWGNIQQAIIDMHLHHNSNDPNSKKQVSFGVVRVANISPCVELTKYLAEAEWPDGIDFRVMAYHSQQVLLMRSEQERHLDVVLKRKQEVFDNPIIRQHLDNSPVNNMIFILVATPVEEVGRDHDFDWAVVEPSSYRSIIQLAGRILRHRNESPATPNMALMQYNLRALKNTDGRPSYCWPGYETAENLLRSHDICCLVDTKALAERVDALPRIQRNKILEPRTYLADLEHFSIAQLLTDYEQKGPEAMQGWLTQCWWLCGLPQRLNPFRARREQQKLFLAPYNESFVFMEKDRQGNAEPAESVYNIKRYEISEAAQNKIWHQRDYAQLIEEYADRHDISIRRAALRYGEISLPVYGDNFLYSDQLGLSKTFNE